MELVNPTPFKFAPMVSLRAPGQYVLTCIVKGTFDMKPGVVAAWADEQVFPGGSENYPDGNDARYETDFVPHKPRADLLLVGKCHPPGRASTLQCTAKFQVGPHAKTLVVSGNRQWNYTLGMLPHIGPTEPFGEMEIRYANSFGGRGFDQNPVGKGHRAVKAEAGDSSHPLPNIEDPEDRVTAPSAAHAPQGFGPLGMMWQQRLDKVGTYDQAWRKTRWPCFPKDFDWTFFNAAPPDMQVEGYLRGDEKMYFENLHPVHSQYWSQLPGLQVCCFVNCRDESAVPDGSDSPEETFARVPMHLDTLWVDMQAEQVTVVWRGQTEIRSDDYREVKQVFVYSEKLDDPQRSLGDYRQLFEEHKLVAEKADVVELELPDLDQVMDKVNARVGLLLEQSIDAKAVNRSLNATLGDSQVKFPDLAGQGLVQQLAALDIFASQAIAAAEAKVAERQNEVREQLAGLGIDADEHFAQAEQHASQQIGQILNEIGVDEELKQLDAQLKELSVELQQQGVNLGPAAASVAGMGSGLRGLGMDTDQLGIHLGPQPPPLTRENIPGKLAAGEGFSGKLLAGLDLSGLDLRNADFAKAILPDANFSGSDLTGANLEGAVLSRVNFSRAKLAQANLAHADLNHAAMDGCDLTQAALDDAILESAVARQAVFDGARAPRANFIGADLNGASFKQGQFCQADFSKTNLEKADFQQANLENAGMDQVAGKKVNFAACNLNKVRATRGCDFAESSFHQAQGAESIWAEAALQRCDFSYAHMPGAFFNQAIMTGANLHAANLKHARLTKADLQGANLSHSNLFQAALDHSNLATANLNQANAYGADFFQADMEETQWENANVKRTLLADS